MSASPLFNHHPHAQRRAAIIRTIDPNVGIVCRS
jgi:hypothetical protein